VKRGALAAGLVLVACLVATLWWWMPGFQSGTRPASTEPGRPMATFVGEPVCAQCHQDVAARWRGSHHDQAMQPATEATVAGNFDNARFTYAGVTSTFFRRDGAFVVRTDGADGTLGDFDVKYTFGVTPLQQYLVELPGGRLQALGIAWDTRPRAEGGQRWFHLYPRDHVTHRDERHWTGPLQNWNHMCAECHSTAVRKRYDPETKRFATTYAEVNVSCEACHGPGSAHVTWAKGSGRRDDAAKGLVAPLRERKAVRWTISKETGNAERTPPGRSGTEVETCAQCHARRGQFSDDYVPGRPLGDTHRVALLEDSLYHPDGQIRDEVYEHGSFLQSKMYHRGVTCSDCHDPHSLALRAPGQQVCLGCHAQEKYASPSHHFHPAGSRGADCLECHMPATTYMEIDPRRDHSFRVPRPDLSVTLGIPNACTRCHTDRPAEWAAERVKAWYGRAPQGHQRYAEALHAARTGSPGAAALLQALARDAGQPGIARASAIARLAPATSTESNAVVRASLRDPDPLVRRAAVAALEHANVAVRTELVAPLLDDPIRAVRMEAARVLADIATDGLSPARRAAFERGLEEYVAAERFNADRPESHLNLGLLYLARRQVAAAEGAFRTALEIAPTFTPAAVNLADLYRVTGRDEQGERVLRLVIAGGPPSAAAHHALGLLLVRQKRMPEALPELETAVRLAPDSARFGYVYAVALDSTGQKRAAMDVLERVLARHPNDRDALLAAVSYARAHGNAGAALRRARQLAELDPTNAEIQRLVKTLEAEVK
jgi:predicted CXXCH cytochrome family protein